LIIDYLSQKSPLKQKFSQQKQPQ